jgi:hypothetical protein
MIDIDCLKQHCLYYNLEIRAFPHIIYESCGDSTKIISSLMNCQIGIWPMTPRYNTKGVLDPLDFAVGVNG